MTASVDPAALAATLRRLEEQRGTETLVEDVLRRLVDACVGLFPVEGGGLMLADEHADLHYAVASNRPATQLEQAQLASGSGPCVDAYVSDSTVGTTDVQTDGRWPDLHAALHSTDIRAVLGVPVRVSGMCVGSLDVYRTTSGDWHRTEVEALNRFAQVIDAMLATAVVADTADTLAAQLGHALKQRVPVERGIGYLMARDGLDAPAAFQLLRSAARRQRRTVSDLARDLVATGVLPGEPSTTRPNPRKANHD